MWFVDVKVFLYLLYGKTLYLCFQVRRLFFVGAEVEIVSIGKPIQFEVSLRKESKWCRCSWRKLQGEWINRSQALVAKASQSLVAPGLGSCCRVTSSSKMAGKITREQVLCLMSWIIWVDERRCSSRYIIVIFIVILVWLSIFINNSISLNSIFEIILHQTFSILYIQNYKDICNMIYL